MEWLTIVLSSVITLLTPANAIIDQVLANTIRTRVKAVEQLAVRVDNTPNYQALQGKVDRVRISGRGVYPLADVRIEAIELETDPLSIDLQRLQQKRSTLTSALRQPASGAFRVILKEEDINKALQSPEVQKRLQESIDRLAPAREETGNRSFQLRQARFNFLPDNRLGLMLELQPSSEERENEQTISLSLEVGFNLVGGHSLQLVKPSAELNGRKLSSRLINGFAEGISQQLDLRNYEKEGIIARVLQFQIDDDRLQIAAFARVEPRSGNSVKP